MPDLPSRREHEAELANAIALAFRSAGKPPFDWDAMAAALAAAMAGPLASAFADAAARMPGPVSPDAASQWAAGYSQALAAEIVGHSRDAIENENDGAALAAAIAVVFGAVRALTIAITETTRAITAAEQWAVSLGAGGEMEPWWVTEKDARVCEVCAPLDETPQSAWVDVAPLGPPAHPRCRCYLDWREAA